MKRFRFLFFVLAVLTFVVVWNSFPGSAEAGSIPEAKAGTFRAEQISKPKVKVAYQDKWDSIKARLSRLDVKVENLEVFIRGFKDEEDLEVWVKNKKDTAWKKYTTYPICAQSGELGPKRCQGDYQVPEGFYHVSVFNPYSNYYISLGVSYPNASDKIFACKRDAGGAIMIHGNCCTIGCIPLTDDLIKELYVLCVEAKNSGQNTIPIHLFPARLTNENLVRIKTDQTDSAVRVFWDNLKTGYDWFEAKKKLPKVTVDAKGKYVFN